MNKPILNLIAAIILSAAIVFSVWYYVQNTRFQIVTNNQGIAYKLDKITGVALVILPNGKAKAVFDSKDPLGIRSKKDAERFLIVE